MAEVVGKKKVQLFPIEKLLHSVCIFSGKKKKTDVLFITFSLYLEKSCHLMNFALTFRLIGEDL